MSPKRSSDRQRHHSRHRREHARLPGGAAVLVGGPDRLRGAPAPDRSRPARRDFPDYRGRSAASAWTRPCRVAIDRRVLRWLQEVGQVRTPGSAGTRWMDHLVSPRRKRRAAARRGADRFAADGFQAAGARRRARGRAGLRRHVSERKRARGRRSSTKRHPRLRRLLCRRLLADSCPPHAVAHWQRAVAPTYAPGAATVRKPVAPARTWRAIRSSHLTAPRRASLSHCRRFLSQLVALVAPQTHVSAETMRIAPPPTVAFATLTYEDNSGRHTHASKRAS